MRQYLKFSSSWRNESCIAVKNWLKKTRSPINSDDLYQSVLEAAYDPNDTYANIS
jgi:hypothetical protein